LEEAHTNWYFAIFWLSFQCPLNAIPCFRANIVYTFVETVVNPQGATKSVQQDRRKAATLANIDQLTALLTINQSINLHFLSLGLIRGVNRQ